MLSIGVVGELSLARSGGSRKVCLVAWPASKAHAVAGIYRALAREIADLLAQCTGNIDEVPPNVVLSAGMTATVEIDDQGRASAR
jgi:hypothetical protein